jgi:hypothetical protein
MSNIMPIISVQDGPRIAVNDLINNPTVVPRRILQLANNQFLADSILRDAGGNNSGVVEYSSSTPLFADRGAAIRTEFGEYALVTTSMGIPSIATTVDRGMSILISDEMRMRNNMDRVNTQLMQVKNTMVRDWDAAFMALFLANASVQTFGAATAWATSTAIRTDILKATKFVNTALAPGGQAGNYLNFNADTMIITESTRYDIMSSASFNSGTAIFQGNLADENLQYTGVLPQKILNLDVLVAKGSALPDGKAIVLERKTVGFISDEEPLQSTPLYRDQPRRTWRSDTNRRSAMGLDQPLAACIITAV